MSIWRFSDWIVEVPSEHRVTLGEGNTPLVQSRQIGPAIGLPNLLFKLESVNPTGSYKDRFAAAAISKMLSQGRNRCVATSSGNTGAALAAYCAAAQIACRIAIVESAPDNKLKQMLAYGADLARIRQFGLDIRTTSLCFEHLQHAAQSPGAALQISGFCYSPDGMSGIQTISYELAEQADRIDHVFCQAGGGGLTLAVAQGFAKLIECGRWKTSPKIECVQPAGNDTIASSLSEGRSAQPVTCTSRISGLQVPSVVDGDAVITACRASGGRGHAVADEEIFLAQKRLAREEGIFSEPAGATSLAGVLKARRDGHIHPDSHVVCLVTGTGFKDQASIDQMTSDRKCLEITVDGVPNWLAR